MIPIFLINHIKTLSLKINKIRVTVRKLGHGRGTFTLAPIAERSNASSDCTWFRGTRDISSVSGTRESRCIVVDILDEDGEIDCRGARFRGA